LCVGAAHAELLIGQTADFSGPAAPSVQECTAGARLALDAANAAGGINGERLRLVSLDDGFSPARALANAQQLVADGAIALFLTRGTPQTQALLPLLAQARVPLVAPSTGAMLLHRPVNPWVFNVRSSYQHEAERVVQHLRTIGAQRLAILRVDDSFGEDAVQGALRGLAAEGRRPLTVGSFDRMKPAFDRLVPALGVDARGVVVSQVFPDEQSGSFALVREARELAQRAGMRLTPQVLEGYAGAKVLIEGLRRAGPRPSRESLRQALEGLHHLDLGGLGLGYSAASHSGLDYVDLAIVNAGGHFER
jgi:ABC-type branched-subunit amino acid transport system substrate-binding protein